MTVTKTGLIVVALVGAVALAVAIGPTVEKHWTRTHPSAGHAVETKGSAPATARTSKPARASSSRTPEAGTVKKGSNTIETVAVSAWQPEFRNRVKAVLNRGADLQIAAADFASPEQFLTVAHAARNTQVPFMVLKDRVVNQGQSLAQAIHEFKPDLDARAEVTRARAAAREDLEVAAVP